MITVTDFNARGMRELQKASVFGLIFKSPALPVHTILDEQAKTFQGNTL
jgi:hypothetical protein